MKPGTAPMTSDLSPVDRLKEIKDRSEAATIGEWCADPVEDSADWFVHSAQGPAFGIVAGQVTHEADAEFIAHSPADVGWLLEHIEQLQAELPKVAAWERRLRAQRQAVLDLCNERDFPGLATIRAALGADRD